jgi:hypothetical protein
MVHAKLNGTGAAKGRGGEGAKPCLTGGRGPPGRSLTRPGSRSRHGGKGVSRAVATPRQTSALHPRMAFGRGGQGEGRVRRQNDYKGQIQTLPKRRAGTESVRTGRKEPFLRQHETGCDGNRTAPGRGFQLDKCICDDYFWVISRSIKSIIVDILCPRRNSRPGRNGLRLEIVGRTRLS